MTEEPKIDEKTPPTVPENGKMPDLMPSEADGATPEMLAAEKELIGNIDGAEFFDQTPIDTVPRGQMSPEDERAYYEAMGAEQHKREAEILTTVQYILEPHLPDDERLKTEFKKYEMLISKNLALSNIREEDIFRYLDYFEVVTLWLKFGQPNVAVKRIARLLMELQLRRSIGFGERLAQVSTRQILEQDVPQTGEKEVVKRKKRFGLF